MTELPGSSSRSLARQIARSSRLGLSHSLTLDPPSLGSGKTAIFTSLIHRLPTLIHPHTKQEATKVLIVVGAIQLAKQAVETVRRANPELEVELEQGNNRASGKADVTVATYQVGVKWLGVLPSSLADRFSESRRRLWRSAIWNDWTSLTRKTTRLSSSMRCGLSFFCNPSRLAY